MSQYGFSGGENVERVLQDLERKTGKRLGLRVGFIENATYPDGQNVATVAFWNEFGKAVTAENGTYFQLPRPFFRRAIAENRESWGPTLGSLADAYNFDMEQALGALGAIIADQIQESIRTLTDPPLAPSTVAAKKGVTKPLIDTAFMLRSVSWEVEVQ